MDARRPRSPLRAALLAAVFGCLLAAGPAAADVPTPGTLTITGKQMAGSKLTVTDDTPFGLHDSTYTWQVCDDNAGTNCAVVQSGYYSTTYRSLAGQAGKYLRVDALYTDWMSPFGTSSTYSAYFGPLAVHDATIDVPGDFSTIQDAIDDASDGDTISIAAGTYPESPTIIGNNGVQSTNLTITGAGASTTHITGGNGFSIHYAGPITMSGLDITHRLVVNETSGMFSHLKAGEADAYASTGLAQTVTFDDVNVPDFTSSGVVFLGANLTATLEHSTLTAASNGSTAVTAGNGARVTVDDNTIDISPSSNLGSKGVYLPSAGPPDTAVITGNTIDKAAMGVDGAAASLLTISGNTITNTIDRGLNLAYSAANTQITDNTIHDGDYGIYLQSGAVITGNDVRDAATTGIQVWASPGSVTIRGNAIVGNGTNFGQFTQDAGLTTYNFPVTPPTVEFNWWGCNGGPGTAGCDRIQSFGLAPADADPWLVQTVDASPNPIARGAATTVTVDFLHDSNGNLALASGQLLGDLPVAFASTRGTPASAPLTAHHGVVTQTLTAPAGSHGIADVTATTDNQTTHESVPMGNPADITAFSLTGTAQFRQVLTANDTTTGDGITKTYTWEACTSPGVGCATIGTNSSTYTVGANTVGKVIRVTLDANSPYGSDSATSSYTAAVTAIPVHVSVLKVSDVVGTLDVPVTGSAPLGFTVTVRATGATVVGVDVHDTLSSGTFISPAWTCTTSGSSACEHASDFGSIAEAVTVEPGHDVVFHVSARLRYTSAPTLTNTAFVTVPAGYFDDFPDDDSAAASVDLHQVVPVVTIDDESPHYLDTLHASDDVTGSVTRDFTWYRCQVGLPSNCTQVAAHTDHYTLGLSDITSLIKVSEFIDAGTDTATVTDYTDDPVDNLDVDLKIDKSASPSGTLHVAPGGSPLTYTVTVTSLSGPTVVGATVTDTLPAALTGATWACAATASSSCAASGSGSLVDEPVTVSPSHPVVFTISGTVASGGTSSVNNTAVVQVPNGYFDTSSPNNQASTSTSRTNAPLLAWATGTNLAYTERAAPTPIDPTNSITVTDPDEDITGATVVVGSGHGSGDTLAAATAGTSILANYVPGTWTLTLSGADTAAHYQQVLRSVTFENQLHNPSSAQRTITITVNDATPDSATKSRLLDFTKVNDGPVVTTSNGITHGTGVVDGAITVSDVDSANLSQATATVSPSAGVTLSASGLPGGLNANYTAGTLTISGTASVANYQSALRLVTLAGGSSDVTVTFAATDDEAGFSLTSASDDKHVDLDATTLVAHGDATSDTRGCGYAANPCDTVQHGVDNASSGDTVKVAPGTYSDGPTTVDKSLTVIGNGGTPVIDVGANEHGFDVNADNVTIDGFELTHLGAPNFFTLGVVPGPTVSGTTLRNLDIHGLEIDVVVRNQGPAPMLVEDSTFTHDSIALYADAATTYNDVVIQDNTFDHVNAFVGWLQGSGTGVTFQRNDMALSINVQLSLAGTSNLTIADNSATGLAMNLFDVHNVQITGNLFDDLGATGNGIGIGSGSSGVVMTGNTMINFGSGTFVNVDSHTGTFQIHRNRFSGAYWGISNGGGPIDATNNWWGCNDGPTGSGGCPTVSGSGVDADPWLVLSASSPVTTIKPSHSTALEATVGKNSDGQTVANPIPPAPVTFGESGGPLGSFTPASGLTDAATGGLASTWHNSSAGTAHLTATLDATAVTTDIVVSNSSGDGGAAAGVSSFETDDTSSAGSVDGTDPVDAKIALPPPQTGTLGISEVNSSTGPAIDNDATYGLLGKAFQITAPDPPSGQFIALTFVVYAPGLPSSQAQVWRDGHMVASCTTPGVMSPAPCVSSRTDLGGGKIRIVVLTDHASFWAIGGPDPQVVFDTGPGVGATPMWTNDNTPTFTFHAEVGGVPAPGALFECQATPDEAVTTSCNSGTYTPAALTDGAKVLHVQANYAGIAGPINTTSFFVDTVNPAPVRSGQPPLVTNSTTAAFTWTRPDAAPSSGLTATDSCVLDGGAGAACGPGAKTYTSLPEGNHTFSATVTDRAGNSGSTALYTWMVDLTNPQTTLTGTLPGLDQDPGEFPQGPPTFATHSTSASFAYTATDPLSGGVASGVNRVECSLDGAAFNTGGCGPYTNLAHGVHTFRIRTVDNAGNVETVGAGQTWTWFVDRVAPDILPVYPYANGRFSYYKDVRAQYSCDDHIGPPYPSQSGVFSCVGDVPVGTPFDHTTQGVPASDHTFLTYPFTINTSDKVGNSSANPFNYRVFTFAGLVLDDNPKAYYRMDDPEGTDVLVDFSGNGNDGTYKNGTESGPIGVSGDGNTARVFTGADGYGYVNDMAAPQHGYTMAAFVQFDDSGDGMVMQHGRAGALFRRGNQLVFMNVAEDEEVAITVPGGIVPGCWYFVAGRFDRFHATVYAGTHDNASGPDCTPTSSDLEWFTPQTISTDLEPSGDGSSFYVGYGEEAPWLHGSLDEVAYFDSILSPAHIKELWLADPPPAVHHAASHSAPSSNPLPVVTHTPKPDPKIAAKARAKAKVKTLTKRLAAAKAHLAHIKRHHANRKQIAKAKRAIATLKRQLAAAKRHV